MGLFTWLFAICITIFSYWNRVSVKTIFSLNIRDISIITIFSLMMITIMWAVNKNPEHYHRDEFILAYTSFSLPPISQIDWFKGYPDDWVAQFPILYHIIQKPFFSLFGSNVNAMRLSILPYNLLIICYLYYFAKLLRNRKFAILTLLVYIFLACSMYFSSLALHHTSSTLFVLASLFHLLKWLKTNEQIHNLLLLSWICASLLTYPGSYIILPIVVFTIFFYYQHLKRENIKNIPISICTLAICILPFITHAALIHNYFTERYAQINSITGSWSTYPTMIESGKNPIYILLGQMLNCILALFISGIGGMGGYTFGKQALFTIPTFILLIVGCMYMTKLAIQKHISYISIMTTITLGVMVGYVLTTQPPPFHRLSILFPYFAIGITIGLMTFVNKLQFKIRWHKYLVIVVFLIFNSITNIYHVSKMISNDPQDYSYSTKVEERIRTMLPKESTILIAAYPEFHIGKELLFRTNNEYTFITKNKEEMLSTYAGEPLLLINPTEEDHEALIQAYPTHTYEQFANPILESIALFFPNNVAPHDTSVIITP